VRRVLFWMHLGAGVLISCLVLFFATTGALLAYERPILHSADKRFYASGVVSGNAVPMPLDALAAGAMVAVPSPIEMVTVYRDPNLPVEMLTARRTVYLANRYSGEVQGPVSPRLRSFFAEVTALHRWFGLSNASHATATAVKGAAALLFLFLVLSGAVLWIPRHWSRTSVRTSIVPRLDAHGRARNYNWHKVAGFWTALPLAVIVGTGVIMAYPWANALLFRLAHSPVPVRNAENGNPGRRGKGVHALPVRLDEAFVEATRGVEDWQSATLRVPAGNGALNFVVDRSEGGHPEKREQVSVDPKTLVVLHRDNFAGLSRGQRWRSWVRFAHTGEAGGWWGESLALISACGAIVLSVTGVAMSLDRLRRWRRCDHSDSTSNTLAKTSS
jgi:uncharacterized iron-regulated membrane protein